jgi:hypothetical protein
MNAVHCVHTCVSQLGDPGCADRGGLTASSCDCLLVFPGPRRSHKPLKILVNLCHISTNDELSSSPQPAGSLVSVTSTNGRREEL